MTLQRPHIYYKKERPEGRSFRKDSFKCHINIVFNKSLYWGIHCSA